MLKRAVKDVPVEILGMIVFLSAVPVVGILSLIAGIHRFVGFHVWDFTDLYITIGCGAVTLACWATWITCSAVPLSYIRNRRRPQMVLSEPRIS